MHNVVPNSRSFAYHLGRRCRELGVDMRFNARASQLVVEGGRVVGVDAEVDGRSQTFRASLGVILATGDYSGDRELKARYAGPEVADVEPVNPTSTGDGHKLALELGAHIINGDIVTIDSMLRCTVVHTPGFTYHRFPPIRPQCIQTLDMQRAEKRHFLTCGRGEDIGGPYRIHTQTLKAA